MYPPRHSGPTWPKLVLVSLCLSQSWSEEPHRFTPGLPVAVDYPHPLAIMDYAAFTVAYCRIRQGPIWTAYHLPRHDGPIPPAPPRPRRFAACQILESPGHDAYTRSGFDRGHLVPNYAIAVLYGAEAQRETFLTTNIAPQPGPHNQGPWMRLERKTFNWSQERGGLYVITGVIHVEEDRHLPNGQAIAAPEWWYKILVHPTPDGEWEGKAVKIFHDADRGAAVLDHRVSIRAIEALAGFNFNPRLPEDTQETIEQVVAEWPLAPDPPRAAAEDGPEGQTGTVDINTASAAELQGLPGIGPALAERIIEARPFSAAEDLQRVRGIGPRILENLLPLITTGED